MNLFILKEKNKQFSLTLTKLQNIIFTKYGEFKQ